MTILKTITLSNIRRFAPAQTIELGKGATILLAPNGTGKTTIFEAIELALTDQVSRLKKNGLNPLIRDKEVQAEVTLQFENWARTVLLENNGTVKESVAGQLPDIFKTIDKVDWPYLLRLTHLLDQRDRDWFVQQAEPREAGEQLAKLPVGKDAVQVNEALGSVKIAMTKASKTAEEKQNQKKKEQDDWLTLLKQRDSATQVSDRPLVLLADLSSRISTLIDNTDPNVLALNEVSLSTLQDWRAELAATTGQYLQGQQLRFAALSSATIIPSEFDMAKIALDSARQQSNQSISERKKLEEEQAKTLLLQKELTSKITETRQQKAEVTEQIRRVRLFADAKALWASKSQELEQLALVLTTASNAILPPREQVEELRRVEAIHQTFNLRRDQHKATEKINEEARLNFLEWTDIQSKQAVQSSAIPEAERVFLEWQKKDQEKAEVVAARELDLQHAKRSLQALTATTDAIRTAVSTIASQMPKDRGDCPVCQAEYEAAELHGRIAKVLEAMDPTIAAASNQLATTIDAVQMAKNEKIEVENELKAAQATLKQMQLQLSELTVRLGVIRSLAMFSHLEIDTAEMALNLNIANLSAARTQLDEATASAPLLKSAEESAVLVGELKLKEQQLLDLQNKHAKLTDECKFAQINMDAAVTDAKNIPPIETLATQLGELETTLSGVAANQEAVGATLKNSEASLVNADAALARANNHVQAMTDSAQKIQAKWLALPLSGEPSISTLESNMQLATLALAEAQGKQAELSEIEKELARWSGAESYLRIQQQIDSQKAERSESDYSSWLENEWSLARSSAQQTKEKKDALDTFSKKLTDEIDDMSSNVKAVEPYWQALLKRLVREPRFAEINLDYASKHRKSTANVKVDLNGRAVAVADIASEAQMTDIQLSFMLSMALVHSWSPWKALLLDDPTQHHDLVHAAAVFDVLRDYIVDHGFQVVIATHDALQARFFLRKLQNDGIDARLWSLVPGKNGVQAKELLHTTYELTNNSEMTEY